MKAWHPGRGLVTAGREPAGTQPCQAPVPRKWFGASLTIQFSKGQTHVFLNPFTVEPLQLLHGQD